MIRRGAFDDIDLAMTAHPVDHDLRTFHAIVIQQVDGAHDGQAAHAATSPHKGRNALDAAVLGYNAAAALLGASMPNFCRFLRFFDVIHQKMRRKPSEHGSEEPREDSPQRGDRNPVVRREYCQGSDQGCPYLPQSCRLGRMFLTAATWL